MALEALHPLGLTINHLLNSPRISIQSPNREILKSAHHSVISTIRLLEFTNDVKCKKKRELEADIAEAARALEDVLDSHVSDQIPAGDSLDLRGIERDVVGFPEKMMGIHRAFNPWCIEEGEDLESQMLEVFGESRITRNVFVVWYAWKAASMFSGKEEDYLVYFEEISYLFRDEQEDADYGVLLRSDFFGHSTEHRYYVIQHEFTKWWIHKAASLFADDEDEDVNENEDEDEDEEEEDSVSSNMVGSTALSRIVRDSLLENLHKFDIVAFVGMAGIGKTDLVTRIVQDPLFSSKFECCIFVSLGPKCEYKDMLRAILAQLNPGGELIEKDEDITRYLYNALKDKKYFIVFDDVWDSSLVRGSTKRFLTRVPGSLVMLTTRINMVADVADSVFRLPFLDKEESWDLLRGVVFPQGGCPRQLEKAGTKIAENCEGLPLLIITVADLLSGEEKTPEFWSQIAANKTNRIFVGVAFSWERTKEY